MAKNIVVLNGAARKNGNTAKLVKAFIEGAESTGNKIQRFDLYDMRINGCLGCGGCSQTGAKPENPCVQKDDMAQVYEAFAGAQVVVFASPVYFWTITGVLKTAADRLYAELRCLGYDKFPRESALLMTAGSRGFDQAVKWYRTYETNLGWKNLGEVLGSGMDKEAYDLGASIE
ncbi:MAG: flavodoxin family protein [Synergistaceae bacterium]|nr:flavodoxin family protein [Synergistaceae bacterium]